VADQVDPVQLRFNGTVPFIGGAIKDILLAPLARGFAGPVWIQILGVEVGVQTQGRPGKAAGSVGCGVVREQFPVVPGVEGDGNPPLLEVAGALGRGSIAYPTNKTTHSWSAYLKMKEAEELNPPPRQQ
jgi:hypothetical protein